VEHQETEGLRLRVLVAYYSWSGNTEKVAMRIAKDYGGHDVSLRRISPVKDRGYRTWLLLSFIPGSRVAMKPLDVDMGAFDLLILGCPKWTFSCPPFNEFVATLRNHRGKKAAFFMTFGGFDEERYLASVLRKLARAGLDVRSHLAVSRKKVLSGEYTELVDEFCKGLGTD
jgi:NAD(P)H dehydrogenase (quinone)